MERKIVFSLDLKKTLDKVSYSSDTIWNSISVHNSDDLLLAMINSLNENYKKLNIINIEFRENVEMYGEKNTFFGIIENVNNEVEGYCFIIPPNYATRSGVLAQQVFPVVSGMIPYFINSKDKKITNRPIFIVNINQVTQTPSMVLNILSGMILEFNYVDIFSRELANNIKNEKYTIEDYDKLIVQISKGHTNEYFKLDTKNKTIQYLTTRIKDGIHVTNEPYWFVLKGYASFYLAIQEGYKCDMSVFNEISRGNKTLDAFRNYVESFK